MNIMTSRVMASIRATNLKPVEYKRKYLSENLWYVPNSILKKTEVINWPLKHWFSFFVLLAHLMGGLLKRVVILETTKTSSNCQKTMSSILSLHTHIFPSNIWPTTDTENVCHSVHTSHHHSIFYLTRSDIHTVKRNKRRIEYTELQSALSFCMFMLNDKIKWRGLRRAELLNRSNQVVHNICIQPCNYCNAATKWKITQVK